MKARSFSEHFRETAATVVPINLLLNPEEAAVIGEPHMLHGEVPVAYVALKEGSCCLESDIRAFCLQHPGRHEVLRKVIFRKELPKMRQVKLLNANCASRAKLNAGLIYEVENR